MAENTTPGGDIHRLLDEAFAGVEMTPDVQDLKEEIRANLVARSAELEASGRTPADAARAAVAELGDVRELIGEADAAAPAVRDDLQAAYLRNRVKPKPAFVVRIVIFSIVVVAGLTLAVLGVTGVLPLPIGACIGLLGVTSTAIALIVGDSLSQETTTNHPMPLNRAGGYLWATLFTVYGLFVGGVIVLGALPVWTVVFAALGVIAGIIIYAFLGATQTNRHKAWVRQQSQSYPQNRFEQEPETAARFGIYTAVIWLVTFAVIVVLVLTVGWLWALLAFVGGFAVMMLTLADMMFGQRKK